MPNEIQADYVSGNTLYSIVRNSAGQVWYVAGQVFEDWGTDSRDADDYDISLTDKDGCRYVGDFDSNISSGRYSIQIFLQAGANPADGDTFVESSEIVWSGSGKITAEKLLANKAVQNKLSGQIQYYDDDGQTVLVTHTPSESQSSITKTPE